MRGQWWAGLRVPALRLLSALLRGLLLLLKPRTSMS